MSGPEIPGIPEIKKQDPRIRRYARLLVRVAVNVQPGQRFTIWKAPVDAAPFVRMLTEEAYVAGASYVEVFWQDDHLELIRLMRTSTSVYADRPDWEVTVMETSAREGGAFLFFDCTCAGVFDNTPTALVARALTLENEHLQRVWQFFVRNTVNWSIATVPTPSWARKVFPELPVKEGIQELWETIFATCRVDSENYVERWEQHRRSLEERSTTLNDLHLRALHFEGPGTQLRVGLPAGHIWRHPGFVTQDGVPFIADIPIEEVFTLPHRNEVEGSVRSTRPFVVNGRTVDNFSLRFREGKVSEIEGRTQDQEMIRGLLDNNPGADRLGEVALVPEDSVVASRDRSFYNTLFDENSSSHLAFGRAYRFCLEGGEDMEDRDFVASGGNVSSVHVDFMVGSGEVDVFGETAEGGRVPIMKDGKWYLEYLR